MIEFEWEDRRSFSDSDTCSIAFDILWEMKLLIGARKPAYHIDDQSSAFHPRYNWGGLKITTFHMRHPQGSDRRARVRKYEKEHAMPSSHTRNAGEKPGTCEPSSRLMQVKNRSIMEKNTMKWYQMFGERPSNPSFLRYEVPEHLG